MKDVNFFSEDIYLHIPNSKNPKVIIAVGKSSFGEARRVLTKNGIYMSTELGKHAQNPFLALRTKIFGSQKVLFPIPKNKTEDLLYLKRLMEDRAYMPHVEKLYDFKDIVAATEHAESGQKSWQPGRSNEPRIIAS